MTRKLAEFVNVGATREVLEFGRLCERLQCLVVHSSAQVSGNRTGLVLEEELAARQSFRSPVEETLARAERLARAAMSEMPIAIVRPTQIVGDSRTGEVDRFDGPYLLILLILSAPQDFPMLLPAKGDAPMNLVPIDYVVRAAHRIGKSPLSAGKTFHLADPKPLTVRQVFQLVAQTGGRRLPGGFIPSRLTKALLSTPGLNMVAKSPRAFVDTITTPVRYDTSNADDVLAGIEVHCPPFESYVDALVSVVKQRVQERREKQPMKSPKSKTLSPESARGIGQALVSLTALVVVTCAGRLARRLRRRARLRSSTRRAAGTERSTGPPGHDGPGAGRKRSSARLGLAARREARSVPRGSRGARVGQAQGVRARPVARGFAHRRGFLAGRDPEAPAGSLRRGWSRLHLCGAHCVSTLGRQARARRPVAREPRQPSLWMRQNDGVFGLGGIRAVPLDGRAARRSRYRPTQSAATLTGISRFGCPTRARGSAFESTAVNVKWADGRTFPVGAVAHLNGSRSPARRSSSTPRRAPRSSWASSSKAATPGLVVDTLGINGARIGTPLAWEEAPWLAEASRRHAALVVVAYGTNEVGDQVAPFRYGAELEALVARARKAAPDADCLVVGPTDRAAPDWTTLPRVSDIDTVEEQTAERVGCAFFSSFQSMGGEGSLKHWAGLTPPLAGSDHVHLTPKGYAELGGSMLKEVVGEAPSTQPRAEN